MSGGMQQRCGLARALAVEPSVLLMDEPFAAVDAQTREILQFELLRIWETRPTSMIFVTHSIEEAVLMGDRVFVLKGRPSSIQKIVEIDLPRPRTPRHLAPGALCRAARAGLEHADGRGARSGVSFGAVTPAVGWAKSHAVTSKRGHGAHAILPTRKVRARAFAHPTGVLTAARSSVPARGRWGP